VGHWLFAEQPQAPVPPLMMHCGASPPQPVLPVQAQALFVQVLLGGQSLF
jgi:hypothetical protein